MQTVAGRPDPVVLRPRAVAARALAPRAQQHGTNFAFEAASMETGSGSHPASRPSRKKRTLAVGGLLVVLFLLYRWFTVYTVRSGECRPKPIDPDLRLETRDENGVRVSFPTRDGMPQQQRPLVVLSYNIEGHAELYRGDHIRRIAEVIRKYQPDIVGLQEVHRGTWQSRFRDQVAELQAVTGLHAFFGRSYENFGGEFGNALLTRGTIVSAVVHPLPSVGEPRTLTESVVDIDGARLNVYVTHLTTWGKLNRSSRNEQLKCVARHVASSRYPYLLMGDFNAPPDSPEVAAFIAGRPAMLCGRDIGVTHHLMNERIDYIFADWGFDVRSARVLDVGPSDHWPIEAELMWRRPPGTLPSQTGVGHVESEKK
jgi:endonuclease/exonuclease/phosphatase family metal-dependent hydrolase